MINHLTNLAGTYEIKKYYGRITRMLPPPPTASTKDGPTFWFEVLADANNEVEIFTLQPMFYDASLKVGDSVVVTARYKQGRERCTITKADKFNFLEAKRRAENNKIIADLRKGVNHNESNNPIA